MALGNNFNWAGAAQLLELDPSWYENESQLREDIQGKWDKATPAQRKNFSRNLAGQQAEGRGGAPQPAQGVNMYGFGNFASAVGGHGSMLGKQLQGAADDVMNVFARENASRVAQAREGRRMEHEQGLLQQRMELERMRLENERARNQMDAANEIRKLKAMMSVQGAGGPRRRSLQTDPLTGQRRWMEDWEM